MQRRSARLSSSSSSVKIQDDHHHHPAHAASESTAAPPAKRTRLSTASTSTATTTTTKKARADEPVPVASTSTGASTGTAGATRVTTRQSKGKARARSPSPPAATRPSKKRKTTTAQSAGTTTTTRTLRPRKGQNQTQDMGRKGSRAARAQRAKGIPADAHDNIDDEDDFSFEAAYPFDDDDDTQLAQPSTSSRRAKNRFEPAASSSTSRPAPSTSKAVGVAPAAAESAGVIEPIQEDEDMQHSDDGSESHEDSEDDHDDEDNEDEEDEEYEMTLGLHGDEMDEDDQGSEIHDAPETVDADGSPLDRGGSDGGFASGLRALQGIMTGMSNRLKTILNAIRSKDADPTAKLMTLQDLAEILSVGTEDTLAGFFQTEAFTKELITILKGDSAASGASGEGAGGEPAMSAEEAIAFGLDPMEIGIGAGAGGVDEESNVQMMLLACRCLANMMEALPGSAHTVVYNGAVPVLCSKLKEIQYIDLAEQTMSTLEKISEEMPSSIVREGGLSALLQYLDFFSFHVQRTAVTAAANSCRSLPLDSFDKVVEVMPILRNVLSYSDQRVVEQGCLAIVRIIDSYRHYPEKLEQLVDADLLDSIKILLNPDATTLGQRTYTQILKMLMTASRASPLVAIAIIEKGFGDTLYHILTGVPPPELDASGQVTDAGKKTDENDALVMQNLVQRPREQIQETLSLVSELLPPLPKTAMFDSRTYAKDRSGKVKVKQEPVDDAAATGTGTGTSEPSDKRPVAARSASAASSATATFKSKDPAKEAAHQKRLGVFTEGSDERRKSISRFYNLLLPTLVEVYSASVQSHVRTKSVQGIVKIVAAAEQDALREMLHNVPMASFLSAILSSRGDNQATLMTSCLQIVELLLTKLPDMYQYLFRKEGVLHEVERLAARSLLIIQSSNKSSPSRTPRGTTTAGAGAASSSTSTNLSGLSRALQQHGSSTATSGIGADSNLTPTDMQAIDSVTLRARHVKDVFSEIGTETAAKAEESLERVRSIVRRLGEVVTDAEGADEDDVRDVLGNVVGLFDNEEGPLSSFEMLDSGLVQGLLRFATEQSDGVSVSRRKELLAHAFMPQLDGKPASPAFAALVKRLQESLSRMEELEVVLAASSPSDDSKRNPTSMLARQLRLRLIAEEGSDIPKSCSNIIVSIHAIATFQAFNDYLRPRILAASGSGSSGMSSTTAALLDRALGGGDYPTASGSGSGGAGGSGSGTLSGLLAAFAAANGMSPPPDTVGSFGAGTAATASESNASAQASGSGSGSMMSAKASEKEKPQPARRRSTRLSKKYGDAADPAVKAEEGQDAVKSTGETITMAESGLAAAGAVLGSQAQANATAQDERPVNLDMEDGNKIVAHTPDGTRIGTPQPGKAQAPPAPKPRASYAAALKTEPTDFHLEFTMGDREIPLDTTIYGAVHNYESQLPKYSRSINTWQSIYTVRFKKVAGPARSSSREGQTQAPARSGTILTQLPPSIPADREQAKILQLLWLLHGINADQSDAYDGANAGLSESAFVNNKITAKLNRQLEEPMIVASACLPDWATDLPTYVPFLFPFETRYTFLQSTSFGYARLMQKWIGNGRSSGTSSSRDENLGFLGRLQRQKVRISRDRILESAFKVFDLYGISRASLEVEFFDEVGSGLGPTLEFYSLVSKEFSKRSLKLWRADDDSTGDYVFSKNGLFPAPIADTSSEESKKAVKAFRMLGQFVAKALMDSRIIDVHLSKAFTRLMVDDELPKTINSVRSIDSALARSLAMFERYAAGGRGHEIDGATLEDLAIDFTLPGYDIELKEGGKDIHVDYENVREYIDLVIDWTVRKGVQPQIDEFKAGFSSVFPIRDMQSFTPAEIVMMTSALDEDWTVENLMTSTKADHGYTMDSRAVRDVLSLMADFDQSERRAFLSFITGSPRLPIGGFAALTPPLTIVRKDGGDASLPSVMTCVNYIKLPDYSSREVLKERFKTAVHEGAGGFHLS